MLALWDPFLMHLPHTSFSPSLPLSIHPPGLAWHNSVLYHIQRGLLFSLREQFSPLGHSSPCSETTIETGTLSFHVLYFPPPVISPWFLHLPLFTPGLTLFASSANHSVPQRGPWPPVAKQPHPHLHPGHPVCSSARLVEGEVGKRKYALPFLLSVML